VPAGTALDPEPSDEEPGGEPPTSRFDDGVATSTVDRRRPRPLEEREHRARGACRARAQALQHDCWASPKMGFRHPRRSRQRQEHQDRDESPFGHDRPPSARPHSTRGAAHGDNHAAGPVCTMRAAARARSSGGVRGPRHPGACACVAPAMSF